MSAPFIFILGLVSMSAEVHGKSQFYSDFINLLAFDSPVFITTDDLDQDFTSSDVENPSTIIKYTTNDEESQVSNYLQELFHSGELTIMVFLTEGHQLLLEYLANELDLFNKGVSGLLAESDLIEMKLTLRLDSKIYLYSTNGSQFHLKEMYSVNGKNVLGNVGTWHEADGLSVGIPNIWERRVDLGGATLNAATINITLLHELYHATSSSGKSVLRGAGRLLDPLNYLSNKLNFTIKYMHSIDGKWGGVNSNENWNGLIGMLVDGKCDIAAGALTRTKERDEVVTFSLPLTREGVTLGLLSANWAKKVPRKWIYMEIMPVTVWVACGSLVLIIAFSFTIINVSGIDNLHSASDSEQFNIINGIGLSLMFFRQIYYDVNIGVISSRILFLLSALTSYLLYAHYTAYFTAMTTATYEANDNPIKSFEDVIDSDYKVIVVESTAPHGYLKNARPGTAMHKIYYDTMAGNPSAIMQNHDEAAKLMEQNEDILYYGDLGFGLGHDNLRFLDIKVIKLLTCPNYINKMMILNNIGYQIANLICRK